MMVYFIQAIEGGPIKIGYTAGVNAEHRLESIQTGSSQRLRIIAEVPGGKDVEKKFHLIWVEQRLTGEWFEAVPSLEAYCQRDGVAKRPQATPDEPRLLAERSELGYTASPAFALPDEPEAVSKAFQRKLSAEAHARRVELRSADVARDNDRSVLARLRRATYMARKRGEDPSPVLLAALLRLEEMAEVPQ